MSYFKSDNPNSNWRDATTYVDDHGKTINRTVAEQEQKAAQATSDTIKLKKIAIIQTVCSLILSAIVVIGTLLTISALLDEITRHGHLIGEGAMWGTILLTWGVMLPIPILPLATILCAMASYRYKIFSKSGGIDIKWKSLNTISICVCLIAAALFILTWILTAIF